MVAVVVLWMLYRLAILIADRCFDKKYTMDLQIEAPKKQYGKIKE